jgi:hypothetical protein
LQRPGLRKAGFLATGRVYLPVAFLLTQRILHKKGKNMELPKNAQEYYDTLYRSAFDGTFPSIVSVLEKPFSCRYRKDGTANCKQRCAAGLLIPDEKYNTVIEGQTADSIHFSVLILPEGITDADALDIQQQHDVLASQNRWQSVEFIKRINKLECFANVMRKEPQEEVAPCG